MASRREASPYGLACVAAAATLLVLSACDRRAGEGDAPDATAGADTARAAEPVDAQLIAACDTVGAWLRASMAREPVSAYGQYTGSISATTRYGCQFTAVDTLPPDPPLLPLDRVWEEMSTRGWTLEPAYFAEGPEGRLAGMRRGSILCVLQHYWDVGSDDERAAQWMVPARYDVRIECFREAPAATR